MTVYTYKKILKKAKTCKTNVKKEYKLGISTKWCYYFAKAILTPKTDIKKIKFNKATKPKQSKISRQIPKEDYLDICDDLTKYVEKKHKLPKYIKYNGFKLKPRHLTEFLARILIYYHTNGVYANQANFNYKVFKEPTETGNEVYDYFVKKTGKKPKTIDDTLTYVSNNMHYEGYFDDHKSNKQVTDAKGGNCTDLLQWLINMAEAEGYEWKCIHVKCRTSRTGHVFGKFKHPIHTENTWITRDPAAVAGGNSVRKVWCENGYVQAVNPSWFIENLNR